MAASKNLSNVLVGTTPNSGDGDLLRDAFIKVNDNFNSLYTGGQVVGYGSDSKLLPGYTWQGDKDTGMYRQASGVIGFSLNGADSLILNENGSLKWYSNELATESYVLARLAAFTGGVSGANITVVTGSGTANVTVNGIPVVSSLPSLGNYEGRIVFNTGDVWVFSKYPTGNGTGLPADSAIARLAGSDSRWVRFRGDTAFSIGAVKPQTAPEGTVFYETANAIPYLFISGQWKTLSSVITSSAPSGLEVLVSLPTVGDVANYSGRTVVVGSIAYIFIGGAWKNLSNYVSGSSAAGGGISSGGSLPATANAYELFRKTSGIDQGLYIYAGGWNTIQQFTANTGTARVRTLAALPSDVTLYNPGDLIIVGGTSYILRTDKTSWDFYSPGVSGTVTNIVLNAGQVGNVQLSSNAVITSKIAANVIIGEKLVSNTITTRELNDLSVTSSKLGANAVTTGKIQPGSITGVEIASNSVSGTKIVSGTITRSQLVANIFTGVTVTANALSEVSQNAGTITSGILRSSDGRMVIDLNSKFIRIEI